MVCTRYYNADACNEWWPMHATGGQSPRLSAWAAMIQRNVAATASIWAQDDRIGKQTQSLPH